MTTQLNFSWPRRLGRKCAAILEACDNIAENHDPLWAFYDWADIQGDVELITGWKPSKGAVTGHLSNLEKWGYITRIHARNYDRTKNGERWYTTPDRVDEVNAAVREALEWIDRFKRGRFPVTGHEVFMQTLERNAQTSHFRKAMGL